jgi:hypothetical protein
MNFIIKAFLVFLGLVVADIFWTLYVSHVGLKNKWKASLASSMIILVQGFVVVEYVQDARLLPFAALGAFVGTILPMYYKERYAAHE